jgi:FkbM family methyltransferase
MLRRYIAHQSEITNSQNSTTPKILVKSIFKFVGLKEQDHIFNLAKKIYRRTGSHIRIQKSYSFNGEDAILKRYLPESKGSYLDIGCGNPIRGSNTYHFYKRGWHGISIDPLAHLLLRHRIIRWRDRQIEGIVGNKDTTGTFFEFLADDFSTSSLKRYNELLEKGHQLRRKKIVKVMQIQELAIHSKPLDPFLMDIDVEGSEKDVLLSIDWDLFSPRVIAVEEWDSPIYTKSEIRILLEARNYRLVSRAYVTSVYVHNDYLSRLNSGK